MEFILKVFAGADLFRNTFGRACEADGLKRSTIKLTRNVSILLGVDDDIGNEEALST